MFLHVWPRQSQALYRSLQAYAALLASTNICVTCWACSRHWLIHGYHLPSRQLQSPWHIHFATVSPRLIQHLFDVSSPQYTVVSSLRGCHMPSTMYPSTIQSKCIYDTQSGNGTTGTYSIYNITWLFPDQHMLKVKNSSCNLSCPIFDCLEDQQPHLLLGLSGLKPAMSASLICKSAAMQSIQ